MCVHVFSTAPTGAVFMCSHRQSGLGLLLNKKVWFRTSVKNKNTHSSSQQICCATPVENTRTHAHTHRWSDINDHVTNLVWDFWCKKNTHTHAYTRTHTHTHTHTRIDAPSLLQESKRESKRAPNRRSFSLLLSKGRERALLPSL